MLEDAIRIGRKLAENNLIDGTSGNLSFRDGDWIVITKTGSFLDSLNEDDFVRVKLGESNKEASSDLLVHQKIYELSDNDVVIHCHGSYNVALSNLEKSIKPIDLEGIMFLKEIKFIDGKFGSAKLAERISKEVRRKGFAVVKKHGIYSAANNFHQAFAIASFIEHSCKVYYLTMLYSLLDRR